MGTSLLRRVLAGIGIAEDDISYDQKRAAVGAALNPKASPSSSYSYVRELFDDYVVYDDGDGNLWKRTYAIDDAGTVTFGEPEPVVQRVEYVPAESGRVRAEAEYPWDECIADNEPKYGKERAEKICGSIRAKYGESRPTRAQMAEIARAVTAELVSIVEAGTPIAEQALRRDGTFEMRIIAPGWGSSGYYAKDLIKRDIPRIFPAGTHMYLDHPTEAGARERPERSVRDLGGVTTSAPIWRDSGFAGPGMYADAKPVGEMKADTFESLAPHIGTSIRAMGKIHEGEAEGKKGPIVEELSTGESIDFVTRAGAGGTIRALMESARERREAAMAKTIDVRAIEQAKTEEECKDAGGTWDDGVCKMGEEARASETDALRRLEQRNARLEEALAIRDARDWAIAALRGVRLPDVTKARIVEQIVANPPMKDGGLDRAALKALLERTAKDETAYLTQLTGGGAVQGMGDSTATPTPEDARKRLKESFVALGFEEKAAEQAARGREIR